MTMNTTRLQSRLAHIAGELSREASCWRGQTKTNLLRSARQAMAASAAVHHTTARGRRASEALLDAALEQVVQHARVRLEIELENR